MTSVLIHPTGVSDSDRGATDHWNRTVLSSVEFRLPPVSGVLTVEERRALDELHPDGRAHFWGATDRHRSYLGRVNVGDVVVLTGNRRILGFGRAGVVTTNQALGDTLWPHVDPKKGSYLHLYSMPAFLLADLPLTGLREAGIKWFQTPSYIDDARARTLLEMFRSQIPASRAATSPIESELAGSESVEQIDASLVAGRGQQPLVVETGTASGGPPSEGGDRLPAAEESLLARLEAMGSTDAAGAARMVRREQSTLRNELRLGPATGDALVQCGLCRRPLPRGLLVAAHVKPRSECTEDERLDIPHVAMAACVLGCDALYEAGYLTVDETGRILTARTTTRAPHLQSLLRNLERQKAPAWTPRRDTYFAWHREHRFLGRVTSAL